MALYNGEWGVSYDPKERVMLGGYSLDGETFSPEFKITDIDSQDVENAIAMCGFLYKYYGIIVGTYSGLITVYEKEIADDDTMSTNELEGII